MTPKAYRLPTGVRPRHYDIALDARPDSEAFRGRVAITLDVNTPLDTVELHARDLDVTTAQLTLEGRDLTGTVTPDVDREIVAIHFPETLPAGPALLELAFIGKVSSGLE